MNRKILNIAVPSIVSNITVPLLALVDTAIAGHLGAPAYLGAIAVGGMLFNMIYWLFGFLRMGTGGLTAQAYGAGNAAEQLRLLLRALAVAVGVAGVLILLQRPVVEVAFRFVEAGADVEAGARTYFSILIWGAPAVLSLYAFTGWFLGLQNAKAPMAVAIVQNVVNICASLLLVLGLGMKIEGVAVGTLVAQYAGLLVALGVFFVRYRARFERGKVWRLAREAYGNGGGGAPGGLKGNGGRPGMCGGRLKKSGRRLGFRGGLQWCDGGRLWAEGALARFFAVNRDIFLRTLCLIAVTVYFTSAGAAMGEITLATNALLMQFFILFSYFMDGFAYAGEALGGRFAGAREEAAFVRLTKVLMRWGMALAALFGVIYGLCGGFFLHLLTNEAAVAAFAAQYLPAVALVPFVGVAAFIFDGLYIGLTATRVMLVSMLVATLAFFVVKMAAPENNLALWTAFLSYLALRGGIQALFFARVRKKVFA